MPVYQRNLLCINACSLTYFYWKYDDDDDEDDDDDGCGGGDDDAITFLVACTYSVVQKSGVSAQFCFYLWNALTKFDKFTIHKRQFIANTLQQTLHN